MGEGRSPRQRGLEQAQGGWGSHLPPNSVVVEPHARVDISVRLPGVQKVLREALPEAHVGATAAPLPGVLQARAGRGQSRVFRDPVAQALTTLERVQLQAVQLPAEGLLVPAPGGVAAASPQFTQGTGIGHSVYDPSCGDGVGEGALSKA